MSDLNFGYGTEAELTTHFDKQRLDGFPVYSLRWDEKERELLKLLKYDRTRLIKDGVVLQRMHGLALAWNYFPHAWSVQCGTKRTPMEVFSNDHLFGMALRRRSKLGKCKTWSDSRKALRTFSGTQGVSNFRPTAAAAIYDAFLPSEGGAVWDMSGGFGGRLLGAIACPKVHKYIATEPGSLTMDGLRDMRDELLPMARGFGRTGLEVELEKRGSEDYTPERNSLEMCFTSPPYGGHERYSDEPSQSYIKFPTNDDWLYGFMRLTLDNCHRGLKPNGTLAINLADVPSFPHLEKQFVAMAEANGWKLRMTLKLALSKMMGTHGDGETHKHEPIFVFGKT